VQNGTDAGYKADALEAFSSLIQYSAPNNISPALDAATPAVSLVINAGTLVPVTGGGVTASMGLTAYQSDFSATALPGANAVASVYMHSGVMNEYILDAATGSNTDWVVTQPLKNRYVTNLAAISPYTATLTAGGACETVSFSYFNREEQGAAASGNDFSPPPPSGPANSICWESNVLSLRSTAGASSTLGTASGVLGSVNNTNINITTGYQNGWAIMNFTGTNAAGTGLVSPASQRVVLNQNPVSPATVIAPVVTPPAVTTFNGLPVTGFMIRTFNNGTLSCTGATGASGSCQGTYSALFNHSYRNTITP
jgi:hypothetical protein